jgi:hypothetical protein
MIQIRYINYLDRRPPRYKLICDFQWIAFIKQDHSILSAYAASSLKEATSSLVFGDCFIHSYDLGIKDQSLSIHFRTYSRHGNICYMTGSIGRHLEAVTTTEAYLKVSYAHSL